MQPEARLVLCLPTIQQVSCYYSGSLASMMLRVGHDPMHFAEVSVVSKSSSMLPHLRCLIADEAIEHYGATHLLWIDSDHSFPPDTAHRLVAHRRPFVGINASTKTPPITPTARSKVDEFLYTSEQSRGLERAWSLGFGLVLIEARVFLAMPKPWFMLEVTPEGKWIGEDAYFCYKARAAGFQPMVDHDLTRETWHYGSVGFHSSSTAISASRAA